MDSLALGGNQIKRNKNVKKEFTPLSSQESLEFTDSKEKEQHDDQSSEQI